MDLAVKQRLDPKLQQVLDRIDRLIGPLYLVGGVLRDCLLCRPLSNDLDLVVAKPLDQCLTVLERQGDLSASMGPHNLTLLISLKRNENPRTIEIATFRHRPGQPATMGEDLLNRDITINALAYRWPDGPLLDPYGGLQDLPEGQIRLVNGVATLAGDPLRALRFFRFTLQIHGEPVEEDLEHSEQTVLRFSACERVRAEMDRILALPLDDVHSQMLIRRLLSSPLGASILPELAGLRQHPAWRQTVDTLLAVSLPDEEEEVSILDLRWAAMLHQIGFAATLRRMRDEDGEECQVPLHPEENLKMAEEILLRMRFSRRRQRRILSLIHNLNIPLQCTERAMRRLVSNKVPLEGLFRLIKARHLSQVHTDAERRHLDEEFHRVLIRCRHFRNNLYSLSAHDLALRGGEILELVRRPPGPWLGKLQQELVDWAAESPARNTREKLEERIREWIYRELSR